MGYVLIRRVSEADNDYTKLLARLKRRHYKAVIKYLSNWDYGGENEHDGNIYSIIRFAYEDSYTHCDYALTWSYTFGYVALYRKIKQEEEN